MSHDGVRFVSAEEAERNARFEQTRLTGDAVRPAKVQVDKTGGTGVTVRWRDGHVSHWDFRWLREACPCAVCHEARLADDRDPGIPQPKPAQLLPMYQAPPRPETVDPVGNYALKFSWNDGHDAGIYSWDYLRNVCDRLKPATAEAVAR